MGKLITSLGNPFVATENNVIDTVNNLLDSKQNKLEFDSTPTENSVNPVTSDGVYKSINEIYTELQFDEYPEKNSKNLIRSGDLYNAFGYYSTVKDIENLETVIWKMDAQLKKLLDDYKSVQPK